jgi:tetratricopeptide (TPR) repeat protein
VSRNFRDNLSQKQRRLQPFARRFCEHMDAGTRPRPLPGAQAAGWSPSSLALKLKVASETVHNWRNGKVLPTLENFQKICVAFFGDRYEQNSDYHDLNDIYSIAQSCMDQLTTPAISSSGGAGEGGGIRRTELLRDTQHNYNPQPLTRDDSASPHCIFYVPVRMPEPFVDREMTLDQIHASLNRAKGRVIITAVHGIHGIGKSTIASAYAQRYQSKYEAVWWIDAQTTYGIRSGLIALGRRLGWAAKQHRDESVSNQVMKALNSYRGRLLLIYDGAPNSDAISPHLPHAGEVKVIVTSISTEWQHLADALKIETWDTETGADFLVRRVNRPSERVAATSLAKLLGGLPLVLHQAASYCQRVGVEFAEYERRFTSAPLEITKHSSAAATNYVRDNQNGEQDYDVRARVSRLAVGAALAQDFRAGFLLMQAAVLPSLAIPDFLLLDDSELPETIASQNDTRNLLLDILSRLALIQYEDILDENDHTITTRCIRLHDLVREIVIPPAEKTRQTLEEGLVRICARMHPKELGGRLEQVARARRIYEIASYLTNTAELLQNAGAMALTLLNRLAEFRLDVLGDPRSAETSLRNVLMLYEDRADDTDYSEVVATLATLANLRLDQGRGQEAEFLCKQALEIAESELGHDHRTTAITVFLLAEVFASKKQLLSAITFAQRAFMTMGQIYGNRHPAIAKCCAQLGYLYSCQGVDDSAIFFYQRALEVLRNEPDSDRTISVITLARLGAIYAKRGDAEAAVECIQRALGISETVFGIADLVAGDELWAMASRAPEGAGNIRLSLENAVIGIEEDLRKNVMGGYRLASAFP